VIPQSTGELAKTTRMAAEIAAMTVKELPRDSFVSLNKQSLIRHLRCRDACQARGPNWAAGFESGRVMKAICIVGSPRPDGSTAFVVDRIIDGMREAGVDAVRFVLGQLAIDYCQGCRACEATARCVQRDDMDTLLQGILDADIILLASPSYWGDVTGQMKVFIDRSLPLCNATTGQTPVPPGKIGVAVAVRAGRSEGENQHIVDTFEHYFGHLGIEMRATLTAEGINEPADLKRHPHILEAAIDVGQNILAACDK
jgi:multimeric flavodoxin WrbA